MTTLSDPSSVDSLHREGEVWPELIRTALRIRVFEEKLLELFGKGQIRGTVHTCLGQEILACSITEHMSPDDWAFGTHRGHGYFLSLTGDYEGLAREILGKEGGVSKGIGGSQHLHAPQLLTNGIQGGLVPIAVGAAACLVDGIAIAVVGDGTLGQGVLYESLNIAVLQGAPVLLVVEDNEMAQTTPQAQNVAGSISERFTAFGWGYFGAHDDSLSVLLDRVNSAFTHVRETRSPAVLHVKTRRLGPHSKGDDNRPKTALEELQRTDYLNKQLASSSELSETHKRLSAEIEEMFASVLDEEPARDLARFSHARDVITSQPPLNIVEPASSVKIRQQITKSLDHAMDSDPRTLFIGEDIEHLPSGMESGYRGAFGVSDDLSLRYPERVRNFPISEQGITGFAIGRALLDKPTIAEIMFGDFATLTIDQLRQQASKMVGIYGQAINLPFLLRTPMGGRRGYGPTHSQSYEGLFLGIPNTLVFAVSPFGVGESLVGNLLALGLPTIMVENKDLYSISPRQEISALYEISAPGNSMEPFQVKPRSRRADATIISYGFSAELALRSLDALARRSEIFVDLFIYEVLNPLDTRGVADSLLRTRRLAIVEEGIPEMGIASSVIASLSNQIARPTFSVNAVGARGDIGASDFAESSSLISEGRIVEEVTRLVKGQLP